jgi:acylphosphatase
MITSSAQSPPLAGLQTAHYPQTPRNGTSGQPTTAPALRLAAVTDAIRRRVVVHGRVQGVFFRDTCRREATALGVAGWVTNRADGSVEAVFEGALDGVEAMVEWTRHGPPSAVVTQVDTHPERLEGIAGFQVR